MDQTNDNARHRFVALLEGIKSTVKTVMGFTDEEFEIEVVASAGRDLVARIRHKKALAGEQDWMAIVPIVTKWSPRGENTKADISDEHEFLLRYVKQVRVISELGIFDEGIRPLFSDHRFYSVSVPFEGDKVDVQALLVDNAAKDLAAVEDQKSLDEMTRMAGGDLKGRLIERFPGFLDGETDINGGDLVEFLSEELKR